MSNITELRAHLMATLASLRDRDNPMEPDRARAIAQVAGVLVDTARVEIDYLKATGQDESRFLDTTGDGKTGGCLPDGSAQGAHDPFGLTTGRVHRLQG